MRSAPSGSTSSRAVWRPSPRCVEVQGRTKYGEESNLPFHVSSADWQESDRVFAGMLSAFGSKTRAIPIGGYGTFDGVMTETFRAPRIEGEFSGEQMRAWDVVWGAVRGKAIIQNSYVDVTDVSITSGSSVIKTAGRYSLGFPRQDGGEEINAKIAITGRPVADLRQAFAIDDYDIDGLLSGEFTVTGNYLTPNGSGRMEIADAVFYGEPVDSASSSVQLEGKGVRLPNVQILQRRRPRNRKRLHRLGRQLRVQLQRTSHSGRVDHAQQEPRHAAVGAAQFQSRG